MFVYNIIVSFVFISDDLYQTILTRAFHTPAHVPNMCSAMCLQCLSMLVWREEMFECLQSWLLLPLWSASWCTLWLGHLVISHSIPRNAFRQTSCVTIVQETLWWMWLEQCWALWWLPLTLFSPSVAGEFLLSLSLSLSLTHTHTHTHTHIHTHTHTHTQDCSGQHLDETLQAVQSSQSDCSIWWSPFKRDQCHMVHPITNSSTLHPQNLLHHWLHRWTSSSIHLLFSRYMNTCTRT